MAKTNEKESAIRLRRDGKTYAEILSKVPVAKSTLSLWLRSVGLAAPQMQRLTEKRLAASRRGSLQRRENRLKEIESLSLQGLNDVGVLTARELWLIGTALYWAEGSKQRDTTLSSGIMFGNSDAHMIRLFIRWLHVIGIGDSNIYFELYVHENRRKDIGRFQKWWADKIDVNVTRINRVYFKRHRPMTNRTNIEDLYHGLLRIRVRASTTLNRKINGWIGGIVASLGDRLTVGRLPLKQ